MVVFVVCGCRLHKFDHAATTQLAAVLSAQEATGEETGRQPEGAGWGGLGWPWRCLCGGTDSQTIV